MSNSHELKDRATILAFHKDRIEEFGADNSRALGWTSQKAQQDRFEALSQIGELNNSSILDVGCGHGDLNIFLRKKYPEFNYTGMDHMPEILDVALQKNKGIPDTTFLLANFWQAELPRADYVLASAALSYRHSDSNFLPKMIKKMFLSCQKAFGFTLLSKLEYEGSLLRTHVAENVFALCKDLTQNVELKQDYREDDFAIFMKK
ncbi:MAG: class I SAM-dependent methyltransferase [Bacteroidia bacterium]|nr:class I SAM-dependent methyltransferase [Bacteroidia bacterium]